MKKKEYLPFHAKVLFEISQKIKKPIYWYIDKGKDLNELSESNYDYRTTAKKLDSENDVLEALQSGAKMSRHGFYFFRDEYLTKVLFGGSTEQIEFFIKNNKSLIGEYPLSEINGLIPKLSEDTIFSIFMKGTNTLGFFNFHDFEKTIELLKNHPQATNILSSYLIQREKTIGQEYSWLSVRNKILEVFPSKLNEFSSVSIIKDYLNSLEEKLEPFVETEITNTLYLRLNCEILQKAYPLPFGTFKFYTGSLKTLIRSFEQNSEETGVVKVHINDSIPGGVGYQYTHIYVNLSNTSTLTQKDIKEIIFEYYGDYLKSFDENNLNDLDSLTAQWSKSKLLYNSLNKDMLENEKASKKTLKM